MISPAATSRIDPLYFRPAEVDTLLGDASKGREKRGWEPKVSFAELAAEMMAADHRLARRDALVQDHRHQACKFQE